MVVGLLAVIAAGAICLVMFRSSSTIRSGPFEVEAKDLNLGEIWAQKDLQWRVPIRNTSSEDAIIVDFKVSCECTTVDHKSLVVPAGSSVEMRLLLDLSSGYGIQASSEVRPLSVQILPILSGGVLPEKAWTLRGRVKSAFYLTPRRLDIKDPIVRGGPPSAHVVRVHCHQALKSLGVSCDKSLATAQLRDPRSKSGQYDVIVIPRSTLSAGKHEFDVTLSAVLASGESLPPVAFPVSLRVVNGGAAAASGRK